MITQKEIRRRIASVRSTQKITRAMKLVAAARLKGAQQRALADRPYTSALHGITVRVSRRLGREAPPLWRRPQRLDCIDLILVTSDRGLCGGFNENLLRDAEEGILEHMIHDIRVKNFVVGRQGAKWLSARDYDVVEVPSSGGQEAVIKWLLETATERCRTGESAGCNIGFNRFVSSSRQRPVFWNLLPLAHRGYDREHNIEYLYEPGRAAALDMLTAQSLVSTVKQALLESEASEHAARMTAMDAATKNADDMIAHLTSVYNRARQDEITSGLMDIINGARAMG
ncbi:MAG: ATP synthase F1 subunit gamma [Proteobacteria bacterium]|nr:ATP synthase F1 subunit gamma [Pseudomonadota bacterium]